MTNLKLGVLLLASLMGDEMVEFRWSDYRDIGGAVEFKDYVVMIEAPLDQQRSLAVIAETKKTFPNKPIRYVVNTHNHFDHLGGVRTYVAEGATIVTDARNRNFYERVVLAPQPRTLLPDRLSQRPFAPTGPGMAEVQTFTDTYTNQRRRSDHRAVSRRGVQPQRQHDDRVPPEGEDRHQRGHVRAAGGRRDAAECQCERSRALPQHQAA
jgi:hypothetical protein